MLTVTPGLEESERYSQALGWAGRRSCRELGRPGCLTTWSKEKGKRQSEFGMEMQSHEVSGGNADSPDASNTRPLMQSTPAQGNVIDPHGSEGTSRFQPNPRPTESPFWSPGAGISQMDSRRATIFQQPTANLLAPASLGHLGQHRSISQNHLPLFDRLALLRHNQVAALCGGTALYLGKNLGRVKKKKVRHDRLPAPAVQGARDRLPMMCRSAQWQLTEIMVFKRDGACC